ncbi:hypothetical protein K491DRAFT_783606 [Lophiostoma macrostomum CBS 122681]|uniref:F-box domain-containing protein n=1 Tax=Lophiostoma macrostomum CBS 122681 TaxID=1314788 RepID=A0A6A6SNF3_9PLEO|nr:hypothetical protein K491DRAFT_783606 [Lophiostoma macrostomum CBS 122681]
MASNHHDCGISRLGDLADELLLCIIEQIDSRQTLHNLAATCSRFQSLTEPFIWRSLLIVNGSDVPGLAHALNSRLERISSVWDLAVRYNEKDEDGIELLNSLIPKMEKLRGLTIESPCPNNYGRGVGSFPNNFTRINYTRMFTDAVSGVQPSPLPMLQSLNLHGHKNKAEPFLFGKTSFILFHPTLKDLTISCTDFEAEITLEDIPKKNLKSTPLESLKFIECNIYLPLLSVALALPKALKNLSIGERLHALDGCMPKDHPDLPRTSHPRFLDELHKQADSLENLTHSAGNAMLMQHYPIDINGESKLRGMTALKHLELDLSSPLCSYVREHGLPESLEKVTLFDSSIASARFFGPAQFQLILEAAHSVIIQRLSRSIDVDICWTAGLNPIANIDSFWTGDGNEAQQNRMAVYKIAAILKARGSHLRLFGERFEHGHAYIPPYMYGEDTPKRFLVYSSDKMFTFGHQNPELNVPTDMGAPAVVTFWVYKEDHCRLPRELLAVCERCQATNAYCLNNGYGTGCFFCVNENHRCEYAPPSSPWNANVLGSDSTYTLESATCIP